MPGGNNMKRHIIYYKKQPKDLEMFAAKDVTLCLTKLGISRMNDQDVAHSVLTMEEVSPHLDKDKIELIKNKLTSLVNSGKIYGFELLK